MDDVLLNTGNLLFTVYLPRRKVTLVIWAVEILMKLMKKLVRGIPVEENLSEGETNNNNKMEIALLEKHKALTQESVND